MSNNYTSVKNGKFRELDGVSFRIDNVYFPYHMGWVESERKFREFIKFPARITDEVIFNGDERAKPVEGEKMEFREKIWNNGTCEFHRFKGKVDKDFFALFKKVFDVELTLAEPVILPVWDKDERAEVNKPLTKLRIKGLGASKIKSMLEDLELDGSVPLVDGKDKAGNPAKVRPFDWEDGIRKELEGKFVRVKVRGTGMDTKYSFKEGDVFVTDEDVEEIESKKNPRDTTDGITMADIPFK